MDMHFVERAAAIGLPHSFEDKDLIEHPRFSARSVEDAVGDLPPHRQRPGERALKTLDRVPAGHAQDRDTARTSWRQPCDSGRDPGVHPRDDTADRTAWASPTCTRCALSW